MSAPLTSLPKIRNREDYAAAFPDSRETVDRLAIYADCLALWQPRINLVAPATLPQVWHRHIADSAQLVELAPEAPRTWVDVGSGAGFPGLVVAIRLAGRDRPPPRLTLVESDRRKCAFMEEVVRRTGLAPLISVDILCARIEAAPTRARVAMADVVSARALAPLDKLLGLAAPILGAASFGLFMKGRGVEAELATARCHYAFACSCVPSRTEPDASIVIVAGEVLEVEG